MLRKRLSTSGADAGHVGDAAEMMMVDDEQVETGNCIFYFLSNMRS